MKMRHWYAIAMVMALVVAATASLTNHSGRVSGPIGSHALGMGTLPAQSITDGSVTAQYVYFSFLKDNGTYGSGSGTMCLRIYPTGGDPLILAYAPVDENGYVAENESFTSLGTYDPTGAYSSSNPTYYGQLPLTADDPISIPLSPGIAIRNTGAGGASLVLWIQD